MSDREVILRNRGLLEAARWHDGALYVSDIYMHEILRVSFTGDVTVLATFPKEPSGLGWRPDGTMLAVSVEDRRLMAVDPDGAVTEVADLSSLAPYSINDMVVDRAGRAYIGQTGFDRHAGPLQDVGSPLFRVDLDGSIHVAADDLHVANGMVVTPDQHTLIVAESLGHRLSAFDVDDAGGLSRRRVWAEVDDIPDGICLDAEGLVWVAMPHQSAFVRVAEGGRIVDRVPVDGKAVCCVLGGDDGQTLVMLCTDTFNKTDATRNPAARIELVRVDVPAATP